MQKKVVEHAQSSIEGEGHTYTQHRGSWYRGIMYVLVRVPVFTRFIYGIISVCMVVGQTADHSATTDQGGGEKRQGRSEVRGGCEAARPRRGGAAL